MAKSEFRSLYLEKSRPARRDFLIWSYAAAAERVGLARSGLGAEVVSRCEYTANQRMITAQARFNTKAPLEKCQK